jgi:hypothetical protein
MQLRRFTRLCNGYSKKLRNLKAAVALYIAWYNFCRVHQTLRVTPAMQAGLANHIWTIKELLSD